jgi:hypothetical protein
VLAIEDRRFFDHFGLDFRGLARAMLANLRAARYAQGGSTLTQQLAKNLFLSSERTFERKLEEVVLALWLELRLGKWGILELYLNRVYFGAGVYGIEAAAQRYFAKPARELTIAEAAIIAGLLKAPSRLSPASRPEAAAARAILVLAAMREAGFIEASAHSAALNQQVTYAANDTAREETGFEYAVDYVSSACRRLPAMATPVSRSRPPSMRPSSDTPRRQWPAVSPPPTALPRRHRPESSCSTVTVAFAPWSVAARGAAASSIAPPAPGGSPAPPSNRSCIWLRSRPASRLTRLCMTARSRSQAGARAMSAAPTLEP